MTLDAEATTGTRRPGPAGRPHRRWVWRGLAALAVLVLLAVLAAGWVAWTASSKLLLLPRQPVTDTPADRGLAYREVQFASRDGTVLRGWFLPARGAGPAPVLVLSHGRGQSREEFRDKLPVFARHGFALLAFDYRASGRSDGRYNTAGYKETWDLLAAVGFARHQPGVDPARLAVVGNSQGAAVAVLAAAADPGIRAVVEDSGFASLRNVIAYNFRQEAGLPPFPLAPLTILLAQARAGARVDEVDPADAITRIAPRPVLVVHGLRDTKVRPDQGRELYAHAGSPKQAWFVPGAGHVGAFEVDPRGYERRVVGFLEQALAARAAA